MQVLDYYGTDHLVDKIYDLINSGGSADYIVEEGYTSNWYYRKWASGIAECWQLVSLGSIAISSSYASGWYYYASAAWYYPTNLFIATPMITGSVRRATGLFFISFNLNEKDRMRFYLASSKQESAQATEVNFYARGLWKAFTPSSTGSTYSPIDLNALNKDALRYIKCADKGITNANNMTNNGIYTGYSLSNAPQTGWTAYIVFKHDNNSNYIHQIAYPIGAASKFWIRAYNGQAGWTSWNQYNQN